MDKNCVCFELVMIIIVFSVALNCAWGQKYAYNLLLSRSNECVFLRHPGITAEMGEREQGQPLGEPLDVNIFTADVWQSPGGARPALPPCSLPPENRNVLRPPGSTAP